MLEQAKGLLPSGGQARVIFRDGLLVPDAYAQEALEARGQTQAEAWWRGCEQARAVGMLGMWRADTRLTPADRDC
jgi:hypothetical protein